MKTSAIHVSSLGKRYKLGAARKPYNTLRESIVEAASATLARLRGRRKADDATTFWALRNISFDIQPGEVVGVIGRNGAGKSTLLKILSRITEPTEGRAEIRGRVGSLLEVGTGFHPELTGRENTFLNGAVLGMTRREVARRFDEIVAFAEVEQFIDTPVKFYSSGMYMRLAFAVAAHLEPEILIVDEVLAVGDAQFQKKCLGKMGEVARTGRTVLFVSHNMQAVGQLTNRVLLLERGAVAFQGPTPEGLARYSADVFGEQTLGKPYAAAPGTRGPHVAAVRVQTSESLGEHVCGQPLRLEFDVATDGPREGLAFSVQVMDDHQRPVCYFWLFDRGADFSADPGLYTFACEVPRLRLYMGRYSLTTWLADRRSNEMLENLAEICPFEVTMRGVVREHYDWQPGAAVYLEDCTWSAVARKESR